MRAVMFVAAVWLGSIFAGVLLTLLFITWFSAEMT